MRFSTLDYLQIVAPYIPPQLMSARSVSAVADIAAVLPPSSNFGFECRLGSPAPEADFLVAVVPSDGSRGAWAGENPLCALPETVGSSSTWKKLQTFLADWHAGGDGLEPVHDAWLEFDIEPEGRSLPVPSFFFGFDDTMGQNHPDLAEVLVERLRERPLRNGRRERLRDCFAALPSGGVIFQVGVMLSRATDEVRLCTRRLMPEKIVEYLERIGWPGSGDELRRGLDTLAPFVDAISLDLAVGETVFPQIGLECNVWDGPGGRAKVRALLDFLGTASVCVPEKKEALLRWLGYCTERSDRPRWPAYLLKASEALGSDIVSTFARTLNHIKVSHQPGHPMTAKAYLGVRHIWGRARAGALS
jgi:hypothetical protein